MRLFLSVPLTEEVRAAIAGVQERLKAADADVRWADPENFHLTVKFLGDVAEALLPDIEAAGAGIAESVTPFRISVRGASAFPRKGPLKTLWVGLSKVEASWTDLVEKAEASFAPFKAPPGNELIPHITLGRVKSENGMAELRSALARELETDCGSVTVDRIDLIQSFLNPTGAMYHNRRSWSFIDTEQKS